MAGRPIKEGLDYFELDCYMDDKVRLIQAEYGLKGFAIVVKLLQNIYGQLGYYCEWDEDRLLLFASECGSDCDSKNLINDVVAACIKRNIFSRDLFEKYHILTSVGIQKRYLNAVSRRESVTLKKEYLLISVPKNSINVVINSINVDRNSINVDRNSQRREEKRREEKRRVEKSREEKSNNKAQAPWYPADEKLNQAFCDFVAMRKSIKKPMTERAVTMAINKLNKLATTSGVFDNDKAIAILEQSIFHSWQDLYELKVDKPIQSKNDIDWANV